MTVLEVFYLFYIIIILSASLVILVNNPVQSVLFLIVVFSGIAGELILLKSEFLSMIIIVVYMGAIAILFLFIVMMMNIRVIEVGFSRFFPIGILLGLIFMLELGLMLKTTFVVGNNQIFDYQNYIIGIFGNTIGLKAIGSILYTKFYFYLLLASIVLLIGMVGAIVLTVSHREDVYRIGVYKQVEKNWKDGIRIN